MNTLFEQVDFETEDYIASDNKSVPESGMYDATIQLAYLTNSKSSSAVGIVLELAIDVGSRFPKNHTKTLWFKNKNGVSTKTNSNLAIPGYQTLQDVAHITLKKNVTDLDNPVTKTIKLYDFNQRAEVPQEKEVFTEFIDKQVKVLVQKQIVNKREKTENDTWVNTSDTKEVMDIVKFLHPKMGHTVLEMQNNTQEPLQSENWLKRNKDITVDKTDKKTSTVKISNNTLNNESNTEPSKSVTDLFDSNN